jgi:HD-GYP domain-containing protein (c-di-GMP phosphodiesterase class II)
MGSQRFPKTETAVNTYLGMRKMIRSDQTRKSLIAIVTADAGEQSWSANCLMSFYRFAAYADSVTAMVGLRACPPGLVLVGADLCSAGGFDFVRALRLDPVLEAVPVLMAVDKDDKATRDSVMQCGANACLVTPYARSTLIATISGLLNHRVERQWRKLPESRRRCLTGTLSVFNEIADKIGNGEPIPYRSVTDACEPLVEAVASNDFRIILDNVRDHDNYSFAHSLRVATYLALFGANLRMSKSEQVVLACGGLLHDVGKMSIPHEVLNKPGQLDADELAVMRGHVDASVRYLLGCPGLPKAMITIAAQHHETLDGSGYPLGLAGRQLNQLTRMASIIDVFSALTDRRVYKPPMDAEVALGIMVDEMGSRLDMRLLAMFREMLLEATREVARTRAVDAALPN